MLPDVAAAGLLAIAAAAAFLPALHGQLLRDDAATLAVERAREIIGADYRGLYRNPRVLSRLSFYLTRGELWHHHAGNLAIHAANTVLFFYLVARFWHPGAAAAAAIFAVHPLQVDAVAYISNRAGLMSFGFSLAAAIGITSGSFLWAVFSMLCFPFLALMSKEDAPGYLLLIAFAVPFLV